MKPSNSGCKHSNTLIAILLAVGLFCAILTGHAPVAQASCLTLADIPLDSMEQAAPGMIMFVLDDSGSMDWSIMCPPSQEGNGVFNGYYYIFPDPGDDQYAYTSLEENASARMMWMSQWSGYNGMYYEPTTNYTPWPTMPNANVDTPRSNPVLSAYTLDMTAMWHEWEDYGVIVDNGDATGFVASAGWAASTGGWNDNYLYSDGTAATVTATWTAAGLDPSTTYNVYARWLNGGTSRLTDVHYRTYDGVLLMADTGVNQQLNHNEWMPIAADVTFSTGTGVVAISEAGGASQVCADAVKFVPADSPISDIARRHYYTQNGTGTYLVNLLNGVIEYYRVNLAGANNNREIVTAAMLDRLTDAEAASAGIVTGRTYAEECQNFANWYSFYRRRELTAKNAIANVINTSDGIFVGLLFINNYGAKDQRVLPVRVNLDGTFSDESTTLLNILYNYQISAYGTPLRNGLKKAGQFFQGNYLKPATFIPQVSSATYPFFLEDKGGSCQQAFTIIFTDGYWNGTSPSIGNADGDHNTAYDGPPFGDTTSDTLADVAMYYFERDLNATLPNNVPITQVDPANQQHMVTYTVAFGVNGSLNTETYKDCPLGVCPASWPSTSTDSGKIDDMFHAAVNGRGKFISAKSTAELNAALAELKKDIDSRLGAAASLATNSVQRTIGSVIYQGTYNTANWYGELSALPLNVTSGVIGEATWRASDHVPAWNARTILSYNGSGGIVFEAGNLSASQTAMLEASGLGTAAKLVDFIRGDTSNNVANGGSLRTRTHILGDIVHSAPFHYKGTIFIGANDGMLHAFDAATGEERFAYVPGLVYDHLSELAKPGYSHRFYVDNTPMVVNTGSMDLLVGGLRKGGKGYFALDVTNPAAMTASNVLWEYPPSGGDDDMGYSYSGAFIAYTKAAGYVVIFGNGYDSVNGNAVLYVLNPADGSVIRKFDTMAGGCNGLSTPTIVDVQLDGYVDFAYAGDLKGNMWKFDLRGDLVTDWTFSYQDGTTPKPLVTVRNSAGEIQPITAAPEVMLDCANMTEGRGLMVFFGTGRYLNTDDFTDTAVQSLYGIWDWGPMWEAKDGFGVAQTKHLGTLNTDRSLSNVTGTVLLEQTFIAETALWRALSANPINWYDPVASSGSHMGWLIDLPDASERCIREPIVRLGVAMFISLIPSNSPCDAGGSSAIYQVDACSGGRKDRAVFDTNNDDRIDPTGEPLPPGIPEPPSVWKSTTILFEPLEIDQFDYLQNNLGDLTRMPNVAPRPGMFYWRVLGQ